MDPLKVPATELRRDFDRYQTIALTQPVAIVSDGREQTVLVSAEEYARLKRRDRKVMSLADFSDADIEALELPLPPGEGAAFDHEIEP